MRKRTEPACETLLCFPSLSKLLGVGEATDARRDKFTSLDQSSDPHEVDITRKIREAIVRDDAPGVTVRNVKIFTVSELATLRGPVRITDEHARIVAAAEEIAGGKDVIDEIEVKID